MSLQETQDRRFDQRTLEYKLQRGQIDAQEYQKYLDSLPDEEGNYEVLAWDAKSEELSQEEEEENA
ncbi:MAG: hypothetical protein KDK66_08490 [Deltaproteobacteria bacterium]|nr:hypothetical protein [Deltaproteobacteria bacterium]